MRNQSRKKSLRKICDCSSGIDDSPETCSDLFNSIEVERRRRTLYEDCEAKLKTFYLSRFPRGNFFSPCHCSSSARSPRKLRKSSDNLRSFEGGRRRRRRSLLLCFKRARILFLAVTRSIMKVEEEDAIELSDTNSIMQEHSELIN